MPAPDVIATLDVATNVLCVDGEVFDLLEPVDRQILITTTNKFTEMHDVRFGDYPRR